MSRVGPPDPRTPRQHPLRLALPVSAGALLAGTLVGFLGAGWWVFDLLANLRLHLAAALVAVGLPLVLGRYRWLGVAGLVGAALNLAVVAPVIFGGDVPPTAGETLDVTFFNTKIDADRAAVIDHLRGRDDDVVVLAATTRAWVDDLTASELPLHVVSGARITPGLEILVLTRDPDVEVTVHELSDRARDSLVEVVVEFDGDPVHVLGVHPVSPVGAARSERRDRILEWIGGWPDERDAPVVVLGDLNATPWSPGFGAMTERSGLVDSLRTHGLQASWPAGLGPFGLPIDHVLHSDTLATVERQLGPSFGSDHRMVHARIARRAER